MAGIVLLVLSSGLLLAACEEGPGTAPGNQPTAATEPAAKPPLFANNDQCEDAALSVLAWGGGTHGAIKDNLLHLGGRTSRVACRTQDEPVRSVHGRVPVYQSQSIVYHVLVVWYGDRAPGFFVAREERGTTCLVRPGSSHDSPCIAKLTSLGDAFDLADLPADVEPEIPEEAPPAEPPPPPPAPPAPGNGAPAGSGAPPLPNQPGTARWNFVVGTQSGQNVFTLDLADYFGAEGSSGLKLSLKEVGAAGAADDFDHVRATVAGTRLSVTGRRSTWSGGSHSAVPVTVTATNAAGRSADGTLWVTVDGAPYLAAGQGVLQDRYTVRIIDGTTRVINQLSGFFADPEGNPVTIRDLASSSTAAATAALTADGGLEVTPVNYLASTTVSFNVRSAPNPAAGDFLAVAPAQVLPVSIEITVVP